jgi:hypothetical protein
VNRDRIIEIVNEARHEGDSRYTLRGSAVAFAKGAEFALNIAKAALSAQPAAQSAQEWISVEDRLPDTARRVLACNPLGYVGAATYSNGHWNGIGGANGWMELPKPLIRDQEKS